MPQIRLAILGGLVNHDWSTVAKFLAKESDAGILETLFQEWQPALRSPVFPTTSTKRIRRALKEFISSLNCFSSNWEQFVLQVDLNTINRTREDYNKYYVLEKTCAFASEQIGRQGFEALPPVTVDDLFSEFPPFSVPQFARTRIIPRFRSAP